MTSITGVCNAFYYAQHYNNVCRCHHYIAPITHIQLRLSHHSMHMRVLFALSIHAHCITTYFREENYTRMSIEIPSLWLHNINLWHNCKYHRPLYTYIDFSWQYKHIYRLFMQSHTRCHYPQKYGHNREKIIVQSCILHYQKKNHQPFEASNFAFIVGPPWGLEASTFWM